MTVQDYAPALFGHALADGKVRCDLCEHRCVIPEGKVGICWVRGNEGGELVTFVKDLAVALHDDPIEKKPLFHVRPGTRILSVATVGCNFRCSFCQNWNISQQPKGKSTGTISGSHLSPQMLIAEAQARNCLNIAYTYSEPTIFFEYAYECCKLATEAGMMNVFVTNGYMTPEALDTIRPYLQAVNVDLKGFDDKRYKDVMGGELQHVKNFIRHAWESGIFVEVTTLVIPGINDSDKELRQLTEWLASVSPDIPYHISRFHPDYKMMDRDITPQDTLSKAYDIAKAAGLQYVYVGNVPANGRESTWCPQCNASLIDRMHYTIQENNMDAGRCPKCHHAIPGIWE